MLLYTSPGGGGQGFPPPLRTFLSASSTVTSDSTTVSGGRHSLTTGGATSFMIPATSVTPGTYEFGAWLRRTALGADELRCDFGTKFGSTFAGFTSFDATITFAAANTWQYVTLGRVELPLNRLTDDSTAMVSVSLYPSPSTTGSIDLDEAYLFNVDSGARTVVAAGSSRHLWVNAATLDWPMPSITRGTLADGTDSFGTGDTVTAWGVHEIAPSFANVFAVTRTALDAGVRLRQVPAWHTNAGS